MLIKPCGTATAVAAAFKGAPDVLILVPLGLLLLLLGDVTRNTTGALAAEKAAVVGTGGSYLLSRYVLAKSVSQAVV